MRNCLRRKLRIGRLLYGPFIGAGAPVGVWGPDSRAVMDLCLYQHYSSVATSSANVGPTPLHEFMWLEFNLRDAVYKEKSSCYSDG